MNRLALRSRQRFGKYRIDGKIGEGAFASVYSATDTLEGHRVALKVPFAQFVDEDLMANLRQEIRVSAKLSHPNILQLKNADFIHGHLTLS